MSGLVLHTSTAKQLEAFLARPSHAVLLAGKEGSGKAAVARQLAAAIVEVEAPKLTHYPYALHITASDGKTISIEQVRSLGNFLSRRVPGDKRRVIIIEAAEKLTVEAQNALLKTLEEPPEATYLILTVNQEEALLPTIRSRVRRLTVARPAVDELATHFQSLGFTPEQIQKANLMSGGLPGVMHALLHEDLEHPLVPAVGKARELIQATAFDRLTMVDSLAKDKLEALQVLAVLQQMAHVAVLQGAPADRWQRIMKASHEASEQLLGSGQPKLVLTNLMLAL